MITEKNKINEAQANQINTLTKKVNWFEEQLKLLKHNKFSHSSEKTNALQLTLCDENDECAQAEDDDSANALQVDETPVRVLGPCEENVYVAVS